MKQFRLWRVTAFYTCAAGLLIYLSLVGKPESRYETFYNVLGVASNATDDEIRQAYARLSERWNPEKNPTNPLQAADQLARIQSAFDVLSDPTARQNYDAGMVNTAYTQTP